MIPINNSDTAWLIVSDYNQENDIGFPEQLREDVLEVNVNDWYYKNGMVLLYTSIHDPEVGGFAVGGSVGTANGDNAYVGTILHSHAGDADDLCNNGLRGGMVGGNL